MAKSLMYDNFARPKLLADGDARVAHAWAALRLGRRHADTLTVTQLQ